MTGRTASKLWSLLVALVIGGSGLSLMGSSEVRAVVRACCFANGTCEDLSRSVCEDQRGGMSQMVGMDCSMVVCPILCGGSAPACNGDCTNGTICVEAQNTHTARGPNGLVGCECVPEIPQGGACDMQPDACAGGLPCVDGVCCDRVCNAGESCDLPGHVGVCTAIAAPAPAVSIIGLIVLLAVLAGLGGAALVRRRRLR